MSVEQLDGQEVLAVCVGIPGGVLRHQGSPSRQVGDLAVERAILGAFRRQEPGPLRPLAGADSNDSTTSIQPAVGAEPKLHLKATRAAPEIRVARPVTPRDPNPATLQPLLTERLPPGCVRHGRQPGGEPPVDAGGADPLVFRGGVDVDQLPPCLAVGLGERARSGQLDDLGAEQGTDRRLVRREFIELGAASRGAVGEVGPRRDSGGAGLDSAVDAGGHDGLLLDRAGAILRREHRSTVTRGTLAKNPDIYFLHTNADALRTVRTD